MAVGLKAMTFRKDLGRSAAAMTGAGSVSEWAQMLLLEVAVSWDKEHLSVVSISFDLFN